MEFKRYILIVIVFYVLIAFGMFMAFVILGPERTLGEVYRIFFFHAPSGLAAYAAFAVTLVGSIQYLRTREIRWDIIAASSAKIGLIFCTLALVTGSIFSNLAWGAYWNWDPRQTTTLILWFIYAGYLTLRASIEDEASKARTSAVFGVFGFVGVPLSYLSAIIFVSLMPILIRPTKIGLELPMIVTFIVMIIGYLMLYSLLLSLDIRITQVERKYLKLIAQKKFEEG